MNTCPVCTATARGFRLDAPDWATDGTGTVPTAEVNGRTVHLCCRSQYEGAIQCLDPDHATVDADGIYRWNSNGSVVPDECLAMADVPGDVRARCDAARSAETAAFLKAYRAQDRPMSDEERYEARAAFGPGEEVVNVITGRRTRL